MFGLYSPAGRLPVTFVRSLDQVPPFADYRMEGRTYRFMTAAPQYRFGYGLSYTRFAYSGLRLDQDRIGPDATATVQVVVTNVGPRAGDEVAQLYVSDLAASVPVPRLHLEGFQRVRLEPGEARTLRWTLSPRQLAVWDDEGQPRVERGVGSHRKQGIEQAHQDELFLHINSVTGIQRLRLDRDADGLAAGSGGSTRGAVTTATAFMISFQ